MPKGLKGFQKGHKAFRGWVSWNKDLTKETAEEIRERDNLRNGLLRAKGFNVIRIWEHETKDIDQLTAKLEGDLKRAK